MTHPTYRLLRDRFRRADHAARQTMLTDAAAFASFSIMTPVEEAEKTLRRWLEAGRPLSLVGISNQLRETREHRLRSVAELAPWQLVSLFASSSPQAERRFATWTWGYGPAKSSFTMALTGIGRLACIDRRIARKYGLIEQDLYRWSLYLQAVEYVYPDDRDSASAQAIEWFRDLAGQRFSTVHDVLLGVPSPQQNLEYTQ